MLSKNARVAQAHRDRKKLQLEFDIAEYRFMNDIHHVYPPTSFDLGAHTQDDLPLVGDRKERNRLAALNSRNRRKNRNKLLQLRLNYLRTLPYNIF